MFNLYTAANCFYCTQEKYENELRDLRARELMRIEEAAILDKVLFSRYLFLINSTRSNGTAHMHQIDMPMMSALYFPSYTYGNLMLFFTGFL